MTSLLPGQVWAATVDHGLRKESDDEARMVAGFCAREHIPHSTLRPPAPITGSPQAAARTERYRLLEQWREANALDHIVTAHHADEQLETIVMRLNRSSGVGGLAPIRDKMVGFCARCSIGDGASSFRSHPKTTSLTSEEHRLEKETART